MAGGASPLWTVFARIANRAVMSDKQEQKNRAKPANPREDRLKAALKANMAKRKAQARARASSANEKEKE